jgi:hypothetical protein
MNDTLFVVLLGTLGFASTCIGLWKDYRDKRFKRQWLKGFKKEFFLLTGIGLCILVITIWQYFHTKNENEREKKLAAIEQKKNDSIMRIEIKKGIDSGILLISQGFGKSFNEQDIKMDSLSFTLTKIRDSVNAKKFQAPEDKPTLAILSNGIALDSVSANKRSLRISLTSMEAGSTNFDIKSSIFVQYENGSLAQEITNDALVDYSDRIPKATNKNIGFFVPIDARIKKVYLLLKGTYTNLNGKNKTLVDDLYEFNAEDKITMKLFEVKKREILSKVNYH